MHFSLDEFLAEVGLEPTIANRRVVLCDITDSVDIILLFCQNQGLTAAIQEDLDKAMQSIKQLTAAYAEDTASQTLKDYYSEVASYFEFCSSPTGSFDQLKITIDNYESNLRRYKNELKLTFG